MRAEASAIRVRRAAAATEGLSEAARCSRRWGGTIVQKGEVIPGNVALCDGGVTRSDGDWRNGVMGHLWVLTTRPSRILEQDVRLPRAWAMVTHIMRFGLLLLSCRGEGL
ncbi:hypothetical protein GCM10017667_36260 [Streptomyces filamentosus]|uniref:Uncharacterized protein n=2 Tax=Streptomyces TaxID=1883 RepID=A0A919BN42_STRFL|nr:hypothetical protein GCM10017667_36260 [Streptomyces filamentosus]